VRTWAAFLVAVGLGSLYFAFLGWFGNRKPYPRTGHGDSGIASRRNEFAPMLAGAQADLYRRLQRPLTIGGGLALTVGLLLVVVMIVS
jgi:hypothetical protein